MLGKYNLRENRAGQRNDNRVLRIGTVTAIYPEEGKARVVFEDRDDIVTKKIPVCFSRAGNIEVYAMPSVGEEVVCNFLANGLEEGFVMNSYYNSQHLPPRDSEKISVIKFRNTGDYVEYDENKKLFTIHGDLKVTGKVELEETTKINKDLKVQTKVESPTFVGNLIGTVGES